MKHFWMVVLLAGCPEPIDPIIPDAPPPDSFVIDFYGEPCNPPSAEGFVSVCRNDSPSPKAYCTPEGVCRPFCHDECAGGVEKWAFSDSAARVCYCEPSS